MVSDAKRLRLTRDLRHIGLIKLLDPIVGCDDVGIKKPDPKMIILAMDRLGIPPKQRSSVIYIGNRAHDVEAAIAAGVRPWLVGFGIPKSQIPQEFRAVLRRPGVEYFSSPNALRQRLAEVSRGITGISKSPLGT